MILDLLLRLLELVVRGFITFIIIIIIIVLTRMVMVMKMMVGMIFRRWRVERRIYRELLSSKALVRKFWGRCILRRIMSSGCDALNETALLIVIILLIQRVLVVPSIHAVVKVCILRKSLNSFVRG